MRHILIAVALIAVSPAALAQGQLPRDAVPVGYDITIVPDAAAKRFTGEETIAIDVVRPTRTLVLNAADLAIGRATFDGKTVPVRLDAKAQTLIVTLPVAARSGRHTLGFAWSGTINTYASGLFAIDYAGVDGAPKRMLATQFEAPDARRFAPMWDEPAFKATFRLSLAAPAGQTAFSNMPATAIESRPGGGSLYRFASTPRMSSYLLYAGVGEVDRKTVTAGATTIGVISRKSVVDQGDYALGEAKRLLAYYNNYFGQPYPLPKMDMIAGPGSSQFFSAMENWGAIFFFEPTLLLDPRLATARQRQDVFVTVAHEMAHQWFGDLVTMRWWSDLWLNEGFASWMESKASADLNPRWQVEAATVAFDRERAFTADSSAATHPIIRPIATVDDINNAFDSITYQKGQAVIRMIEATLGEAPFRDGIRRYMAKYRYSNTLTDQLWAELAAASGQPVAEIAHDFTLQGGVPLVTLTGARCVGGRTVAALAQGRFGVDAVSRQAQMWRVPLTVATLGGGEARAIVRGASTRVDVPGCGALVLNRGKGSYVRVMYDDAAHAALVRDYPRLTLSDRVGTLGDDFALARAGYQPLARWAAVSDRLGADASPLEWDMAAQQLGGLAGLYAGTPLGAKLDALTVRRLAPVLERLGTVPTAGEEMLVANARETLIGTLAGAGDPALAKRLRTDVARLADDRDALPPATRRAMLAAFAEQASALDWERLKAMALAEKSPVARNELVGLLGTARDPAVTPRALALLEGDAITDQQKAALLAKVAAGQPDLAFGWALAHEEAVRGFIEASNRSRYVPELLKTSRSAEAIVKLDAYAARMPESREVVGRTKAAIAARRETIERLRPQIEVWVG